MIERELHRFVDGRLLDIPSSASVFKIVTTGYNQSVTGCGSQRRHVVVTQRKLT